MIRVTTIYAASAGASARYYTGYLTQDTGELPGVDPVGRLRDHARRLVARRHCV
jgi:hypothetical protein